jgi:hypothetical protein
VVTSALSCVVISALAFMVTSVEIWELVIVVSALFSRGVVTSKWEKIL